VTNGLLAMIGVGLSLLVLTTFVVPALLAGRPAILVALVGSLAVMFVTLVLTNGVGAQTLAAALGIAATLLLTSVLAILASNLAALDGKASELSSTLSAQTPGLGTSIGTALTPPMAGPGSCRSSTRGSG
jgi:uncharacterized membrane protein